MTCADRTSKPPLRCSLLLISSLTPLPSQWDRRQSCKYTLGATLVIISQKILIAHHKSFGRATIARHNIKHVLWRAIGARVAFYSRPGLSWKQEIEWAQPWAPTSRNCAAELLKFSEIITSDRKKVQCEASPWKKPLSHQAFSYVPITRFHWYKCLGQLSKGQ